MPHPEEQYSKRNPQPEDYDNLRRKAMEHPPRNYLLEEPYELDEGHDQEDEF